MPKVVDHKAYREELLDRYFELFAKRGYSDVTMREIAAELGVSTGTLYHYFPTKKSILEQLFKKASRLDASELFSRIPDGADLSQRISILFDFVQEKEIYYQDIVLLTIDYYRHHDSDEYRDIITEADNYYGEAIAQAVGLDIKLGFLLAIFLNGLVYHRLAFPQAVSFNEPGDVFQKMFLKYMEAVNKKP